MKSTFKRAISLVIMLSLILGIAPMISLPTGATMPSMVKTNINSLVYYFTAENVEESCEVTFELTGPGGWPNAQTSVYLSEDGEVIFEFAGLNLAGFGNIGYVEVIEDSPVTLTLDLIEVNGYALVPNEDFPRSFTLSLGVEGENGLPHQWWTDDISEGDIFANSEEDIAYIQYTGADFQFYIPGQTTGTDDPRRGDRVDIQSLTYNFNVDGYDTATDIEFTIQTVYWDEPSVQTRIFSSNAPLKFTFTEDDLNTSALRNPGFVSVVEDSPITLELVSIIVNEAYTLLPNMDLGLDFTLTLGTDENNTNGLPNQWHGLLVNGDKLAITEDGSAFFEFQKDEGWYFFVESEYSDRIMQTSRSMDYAQAMGAGWNLGNTLDGFLADGNYHFDPEDDKVAANTLLEAWEMAWGNPVATKELIKSIKERGFDHIRIPFTVADRGRDRGAITPAANIRFEINKDWLDRYVEVVQWAVDADLYVMINLHHDSWFWLGRDHAANPMRGGWDGSDNAAHLRRFKDYWTQLATAFKDMPDTVMFETINEPEFNYPQAHGQARPENIRRNNVINQAAYDIIRSIEGNEERMIVIPTYMTNHAENYSKPLHDFIAQLEDENVLATVHYYSEWVWSQHLGRMRFDERLYTQYDPNDQRTARTEADAFIGVLDKHFLSEGIGVTIGEWGLLGYDSDADSGGVNALQRGEELKYYEYINHLSRDTDGVSISFWDNGSGIDRNSKNLDWKVERVGEMLLSKERSAYSTGLDTIYFSASPAAATSFELTLNGNKLESIAGIPAADWSVNAEGDVVTITRGFLLRAYNSVGSGKTGNMATISLKFDGGVDWDMHFVKTTAPKNYEASGTRNAGLVIPIEFNGKHIERISTFRDKAPETLTGLIDVNWAVREFPQGIRVGGNNTTWWPYLQYGDNYAVDYSNNTLSIRRGFFMHNEDIEDDRGEILHYGVLDGRNIVVIEFFDGTRLDIEMTVAGNNVSVKGEKAPVVIPEVKLGDVNGNDIIDIGDALEILKFLAGLESALSDPKAMDAARITVTAPETPKIACVLEILKHLAGIDSVLD